MGHPAEFEKAEAIDHLAAGIQRGCEHNVQSKPWGTSTTLVFSENIQIEMISVTKGGYSSPHEHLNKLNLFLVTEGCLKVMIFQRASGGLSLSSQHLLTPGEEALIVAARRTHQFVCLEECVAYEVYWPIHGQVVNRTDIRRYGSNGLLRETDGALPSGVVRAPTLGDPSGPGRWTDLGERLKAK